MCAVQVFSIHTFWQMPSPSLPKSSSSPFFHAYTSEKIQQTSRSRGKGKKTIIIYWTMYHYFCHARDSCNENLWDFFYFSLARLSPFRRERGFMRKSWRERLFNVACTAGYESWRTIDKRRSALWALPGSFSAIWGEQHEELSSVKLRTFRNCPQWPWFFILGFMSCLLHKNNIISYFHCYFYSSHLHTFFFSRLSFALWICSCCSSSTTQDWFFCWLSMALGAVALWVYSVSLA